MDTNNVRLAVLPCRYAVRIKTHAKLPSNVVCLVSPWITCDFLFIGPCVLRVLLACAVVVAGKAVFWQILWQCVWQYI